ncbi:MAG TPA: AAA family ATPase [Thermoanaerobaculia bacterium]|nr:AAA family ATPase [Thermoanaerobaculia bacterium]
MRIVISGTHCSGKSTLIEDFLTVHHDYLHEPEPYEWLADLYGEAIAAEPTAADFYRQLEISVDRVQRYGRGTNVIIERSALDFLAYLIALADLGRTARDCELIASAADLAATGMANIDLLVVLPLNGEDGIVAPESEDLELRDATNDRLLELLTEDQYSPFGSGRMRIVEVRGKRHERMGMLEEAVL